MKHRWAAGAVIGSVAVLAAAVPGSADPENDLRRSFVLRQAVTTDAVYARVRQFDRIGRANGNTRVAGKAGYDSSARYVFNVLRRAGYTPVYQEFQFQAFEAFSSSLAQTAPAARTFTVGTEYTVAINSASTPTGPVSGTVQAVDVNLNQPGGASTSGCEATDFAGFAAGNVALVQRGTCGFIDKVRNAEAAGAVAVVIFNQGNTPDREGIFEPSLSTVDTNEPYTGALPVVFVPYAEGRTFATTPGTTLSIEVDAFRGQRTTRNVIAETAEGRADNVVMLGAHLDSVPAGPGVNDNATGSAAILEVAVQLNRARVKARTPINNKVRFAWWSAEESGLIGSDYYVANLSAAQRADIALYLNFDMIGSPNFMRGIYDADTPGSAVAPPGSDQIEAVFRDYFDSRGLPSVGTDFSGRSDYGPFIATGVDIPAGGLFTGAEGVKTPEEAALFGGTAGLPYDPCYHLACDTIANVNKTVLGGNANAIAHATATFARNTFLVNGEGEDEDAGPEIELQAVRKAPVMLDRRGPYFIR